MLLNTQPRFSGNLGTISLATCTSKRRYNSYGKKLRTYFEIPAFTVPNIWRGASEIVYRFDFELTQINFLNAFRNIDPESVNFVATVSWLAAEDTLVTYKLWENVGEILWLPLYSGEKINAERFHIEIWNTDTSVPIMLGIEGMDGVGLGIDGLSGVGLGVQGVDGGTYDITLAEALRFYTSRLVIPDCCCESDDISLGEPDTCSDPIFYLGNFQPAFGDYYVLEAPCARTLVKGLINKPDFNLLQNRDDETWHYVWMEVIDSNIYLSVDPNSELAPPEEALGFFPMIGPDGKVYKFELCQDATGSGNYFVADTEIDPEFASRLNVVLIQNVALADDDNLYGFYLTNNAGGDITFNVIQSIIPLP